MRINAAGKNIILNPSVTNIDESIVSDIAKFISTYKKDTSLVLDLESVVLCDNKFFLMLSSMRDYNISLLNVDSRILSVLYMTGFDKFVRIFEDESSLEANSNELINRRLMLIKS